MQSKWLRRIEEMNKKYGTKFKTIQDVKNFQKLVGLTVDGKIGPDIEKKIKELYEYYLSLKPGFSEDNPIELSPGIEVVAQRPLVTKLFSAVDPYVGPVMDKLEELRNANPMTSDLRIQVVGDHYGPDNPFRLGNDFVANVIMEAALTAATGLGMSNLIKFLVTNGYKAIPAVIATLAGAKGGQELFENAIKGLTGRTWDEVLQEWGLNDYNRALNQPGAWLGSWGAGKLVNGVMTNGRAWLEGTTSRTAMTPEGPVEVQPGQTVVLSGKPVSYLTGTQGTSVYRGMRTTKTGTGGSASGQLGRVLNSTGYGLATRGLLNRVYQDVLSSRGGASNSYTNQSGLFGPVLENWWTPWFYNSEPAPVETPPEETPDYRLEEYAPYTDPFIIWYASQPEGTTQYYSGDPLHDAGYYVINRTRRDIKSTKRNVGDNQGWVIPDSAKVYENTVIPSLVNVLEGGVPDEAVRSKTEKITGYRIGGRLIKPRKFGYK